MNLKLVTILLFDLCITAFSFSQQSLPIQWRYDYVASDDGTFAVQFHAQLKPGWHIYSQHLADGGPIPTQFNFATPAGYELTGDMEEQGRRTTYFDRVYELDVTWYTDTVLFTQRLKLRQPAATVTGVIEYMVCNEHTCIPWQQSFSVLVTNQKAG